MYSKLMSPIFLLLLLLSLSLPLSLLIPSFYNQLLTFCLMPGIKINFRAIRNMSDMTTTFIKSILD